MPLSSVYFRSPVAQDMARRVQAAQMQRFPGTRQIVAAPAAAPTPGIVAASPLTQADRDHLRSRACEFVRIMANYLGGFQFNEKNRSMVAQLAGASLMGSWGGPLDELPPKHVAAHNYVYENLNQAGFCYEPPTPGGTPPVPPSP